MEKTERDSRVSAGEGAPEKTFVIEFGGEQRALNLDELIAFAQKCASQLDAVNADLPDLQEFIRQYPEVTDIPDEVAQAMRGGQGLVEAYRAYENARLRDELGAAKANARNQAQSIGSVRGDGGADSELAELMRVFESVFK